MNPFSDGMRSVLQRHPARSAAETRELGSAFKAAQERVCEVLAELRYPLERIASDLKEGRLGFFREGSDRDRKSGTGKKAAYRFAGFAPSHLEEFQRRQGTDQPAAWEAEFLMRFTFDVIEQVALRGYPAPGGREVAAVLSRLEEALAEAHRLRGEILTGNLLLVAKVAIRRARCHRASVMDDLFAAGTDGLMIAVGRYDPCVGHFSTYAIPWISMAIDRYVAKTSNVIRLPIGLQEKARRARRTADAAAGAPATPAIPEIRSFEDTIAAGDGGEMRLEEVIADCPAARPREAAERSDISGILSERLRKLDDLKQLIIAMRSDLGDAAEIGARLFNQEIASSLDRGRAIAEAAMKTLEEPARIAVAGVETAADREQEIEFALAV